jgi:hypothetical protein
LLQVAQVLLTLPYSFSQLGMVSGIILQLFYGFLGSWTAYLISVLYVEYRSRKEKEGVSFKNHVIQVPCSPAMAGRAVLASLVLSPSSSSSSSSSSLQTNGFRFLLILLYQTNTPFFRSLSILQNMLAFFVKMAPASCVPYAIFSVYASFACKTKSVNCK